MTSHDPEYLNALKAYLEKTIRDMQDELKKVNTRLGITETTEIPTQHTGQSEAA